jgi:NADH:ubiquinone oxidoreductase subunit 3 (subunit A)
MHSLITLLIIVPIVAAALIGANALFSISRPDTEKLSSFECGLSTVLGQTRTPFDIVYSLVAILFLLFDLEILLLYPLAISLPVIGTYGF